MKYCNRKHMHVKTNGSNLQILNPKLNWVSRICKCATRGRKMLTFQRWGLLRVLSYNHEEVTFSHFMLKKMLGMHLWGSLQRVEIWRNASPLWSSTYTAGTSAIKGLHRFCNMHTKNSILDYCCEYANIFLTVSKKYFMIYKTLGNTVINKSDISRNKSQETWN